MKRRFRTSSRLRETAQAATLIEALAGLVVLGVLLLSITIARGRFMRQRAIAEQKIAATAAVDSLVSRWMAGDGAAIPIASTGILDGLPNHTWHTRVIETKPDLAASIVRLEITNPSNAIILTLDLVRHDDRRKLQSGGAK